MGVVVGGNITKSYANLTDGTSFGLGDRYEDHRGNEYVFVQAGSAVAQFDACIIGALSGDPTYQAFPVTSTNVAGAQMGGPFVGVAQAAAASAEYFWACIYGRSRVTVLTACLPNVPLYTTATAGALDDAIVTAGTLLGIRLELTASGTTAITAFLQWPSRGVNPDAA